MCEKYIVYSDCGKDGFWYYSGPFNATRACEIAVNLTADCDVNYYICKVEEAQNIDVHNLPDWITNIVALQIDQNVL